MKIYGFLRTKRTTGLAPVSAVKGDARFQPVPPTAPKNADRQIIAGPKNPQLEAVIAAYAHAGMPTE